jgi:hypothetical protein
MIKIPHKLSTLLLLSALSAGMAACTQPAEEPEAVAHKYWQLLQSGNTQEAEKLISANSQQAFKEHSARILSNSQFDTGEARTIVSTTITTVNPENNIQQSETFDTVLVLQNGQWKIDANQSPIPPEPVSKKEEIEKLKNELSESLHENIKSIDEAMNQGLEMLNEAMHEGSKEMGQSLLNMMNELNTSMKKSIDKMKQRRQQPPENSPQQEPDNNLPTPDPDKGEGMI